jgi:hypothetical protein
LVAVVAEGASKLKMKKAGIDRYIEGEGRGEVIIPAGIQRKYYI